MFLLELAGYDIPRNEYKSIAACGSLTTHITIKSSHFIKTFRNGLHLDDSARFILLARPQYGLDY
jgi:hypothetical protein